MRYQVRHPIRHGGKRHEPSAIIEMTEKQAAPHLRAGVLHALPAETDTPPALEKSGTEDAKAPKAKKGAKA